MQELYQKNECMHRSMVIAYFLCQQQQQQQRICAKRWLEAAFVAHTINVYAFQQLDCYCRGDIDSVQQQRDIYVCGTHIVGSMWEAKKEKKGKMTNDRHRRPHHQPECVECESHERRYTAKAHINLLMRVFVVVAFLFLLLLLYSVGSSAAFWTTPTVDEGQAPNTQHTKWEIYDYNLHRFIHT